MFSDEGGVGIVSSRMRRFFCDRGFRARPFAAAVFDLEDAYFTGDEAPGGDNSTPDQDIVDDIGRALGVEYQDNEELRASDKVADRDKHRWELDPASSEDYRDRK